MPEDSKKNQNKKVNEPKEQRKPRQKLPNQVEKQVPVKVPEKPVYPDPGPEFYQNLKRETDVLKITEESNAKYNKKEIKSNWTKYELPIQSYEDVEKEEDMGEDYEKLIQTQHSSGGHFQFKHEKSWGTVIGPSEYDKYFDIDPDTLANAISSIAFYERNDMHKDMFTESELLTMNQRADKYRARYENKMTDYDNTIEEIVGKLKVNKLEVKSEDNLGDIVHLKAPKEDSEFKTFPKSVMLLSTDSKEMPPKQFHIADNLEELLNTTENIEEQSKESKVLNTSELLIRETSSESEKSTTAAVESPDNLEKWLDDFLNN